MSLNKNAKIPKKFGSKAENVSKRTVQSHQENNRKKPKIFDLKPFEEEDHGFVFVRKRKLDEFVNKQSQTQLSEVYSINYIIRYRDNPILFFASQINNKTFNVSKYNYGHFTQGENSNSSNQSHEIQTFKQIMDLEEENEENSSVEDSINSSPVNMEHTVTFTLPYESLEFVRPRDSLEKNRRTSEKRGKRRASSVRDGFLDFYRHIQPELPNPVRLKQLLMWCAQRTLGTQKHENEKVLNIVKKVQKDVIRDLSENIISTSCECVGNDDVVPKKLHPENEKNKTKLEALKKTLERLNKEEAEWDRLVSELNSLYDSVSNSDQNPSDYNNVMLDEIDFTILPEQQLKFLKDDDPSEKKQLEFLEEMSKSLEIN
ncbi:12607_t:CDS:2, partial [Entrophospora sp. SA101]